MARALITGAAGFIGFHLARRLLAEGWEVVGVDNLSPYYDVQLKQDRLALLEAYPSFTLIRGNLADAAVVDAAFDRRPEYVLHFAAQAGVRYSLKEPMTYVQSNIVAFTRLLEACRMHTPRHLIFASSSSVYGGVTEVPFREAQCVDYPVSVYAATKKADELLAHTYSHLSGIPATGVRLFTVYGPWGRPDMAYFLFTEAILKGKPIRVYNYGQMERDFTYIDDVVEAIVRLMPYIPGEVGAVHTPTGAPYRVFNVGSDRPVSLMAFIDMLEQILGREAVRELLPLQPGDVPATWADVSALEEAIGFRPETPLRVGLEQFVNWYHAYQEQRRKAGVPPLMAS